MAACTRLRASSKEPWFTFLPHQRGGRGGGKGSREREGATEGGDAGEGRLGHELLWGILTVGGGEGDEGGDGGGGGYGGGDRE